mmetsp:Transcript_20265/g.55231  ORF Transcript_20265/g.55231 Transcript_20265/m.55231 type:complete len:367 (-) Transcript_20265:1089-2189(-)
MRETWASAPWPSKAFRNIAANFFVASQPEEPTLPLPSSASTRSSFVEHISGMLLSLMQGCSLHFLRSSRSGLSTAGHSPRPTAACLTVRRRVLVPESQALEHSDHGVHFTSPQSLSHACMLQGMASEVSPQGSPSYLGCTLISRERWLTPPPQPAEHALKPLHCDILQLIGQGCSLHVCTCFVGGHCAPPPLGGVMIARVSSWVPPPQDAEHSFSSHFSATSQSWKKGCLSPFILLSSPRIFFKAQSSDSRERNLELQEVRISSIDFFSSECCTDFVWPSSPASFSLEVDSASLVCSLASFVVNASISASRVSLVSLQAASKFAISSSSSSRLSTVSPWMVRNLFCKLKHAGLFLRTQPPPPSPLS